MRFIAAENLKEKMVLGHSLYGKSLETRLMEGQELADSHIKWIREMGYLGIYIQDGESEDVQTEDIISPELRVRTIQAVTEILNQAESVRAKRTIRKTNILSQQKVVEQVISALIDNKRRIVDMVDLKPTDSYDSYHAANVVILSLLLGIQLGISGRQLYELGIAALMHDAGNIFIPEGILEKTQRLTEEEYEQVKRHTEKGFDFLRENFDVSIDACTGALQHHEHFDGTGYPARLKGTKISIYGRIIAVTDVYDALISRRPFRKEMSPVHGVEYMKYHAGSLFDPEIVASLEQVIALYPTGTEVVLSSGVRCLVVENFPGHPDRPKVRLLHSMSRAALYIDLCNDPQFAKIRISHGADL